MNTYAINGTSTFENIKAAFYFKQTATSEESAQDQMTTKLAQAGHENVTIDTVVILERWAA